LLQLDYAAVGIVIEVDTGIVIPACPSTTNLTEVRYGELSVNVGHPIENRLGHNAILSLGV
jgi:hypothetical protein